MKGKKKQLTGAAARVDDTRLSAGDSSAEAEPLGDIALSYDVLGENQKALNYN